MASATAKQFIIKPETYCFSKKFSSRTNANATANATENHGLSRAHKCRLLTTSSRKISIIVKSSGGVISTDDGDGVSLGTMKLPLNIDIQRFETLLFQWANSLCQGAQLPLPVPLKVDKVEGGVKLGFVEIDDGKTEVFVYINCLVIPGSNDSDPPTFVATRNGTMKNKVPPGEPRIMKSLLAALQKSVEIARI